MKCVIFLSQIKKLQGNSRAIFHAKLKGSETVLENSGKLILLLPPQWLVEVKLLSKASWVESVEVYLHF